MRTSAVDALTAGLFSGCPPSRARHECARAASRHHRAPPTALRRDAPPPCVSLQPGSPLDSPQHSPPHSPQTHRRPLAPSLSPPSPTGVIATSLAAAALTAGAMATNPAACGRARRRHPRPPPSPPNPAPSPPPSPLPSVGRCPRRHRPRPLCPRCLHPRRHPLCPPSPERAQPYHAIAARLRATSLGCRVMKPTDECCGIFCARTQAPSSSCCCSRLHQHVRPRSAPLAPPSPLLLLPAPAAWPRFVGCGFASLLL